MRVNAWQKEHGFTRIWRISTDFQPFFELFQILICILFFRKFQLFTDCFFPQMWLQDKGPRFHVFLLHDSHISTVAAHARKASIWTHSIKTTSGTWKYCGHNRPPAMHPGLHNTAVLLFFPAVVKARYGKECVCERDCFGLWSSIHQGKMEHGWHGYTRIFYQEMIYTIIHI